MLVYFRVRRVPASYNKECFNNSAIINKGENELNKANFSQKLQK